MKSWVAMLAVLVLGLLLVVPESAWALTATANPTSCITVAGSGRVWSNPSRAVSSNNSRASARVDGTTTNYLQCTGYGFAIPSGATINGITVNVERRSSRTSNGGSRDAAMRLVKAGVAGTTDRSTSTIYTTSDVIEAHGGSSDLWGATWTPADINAANFGAAFMATKPSSSGNSHTISVDWIQIVVTYTQDTTPPVASSIIRASFSPTGAGSVSWAVTFSESVTGVDAADFGLVQAGGVSGATITSVSGSGTTYTVTASTGSGSGTLGLNLVDNDSIIDGSSNRLGGTGAGNGNFTGQVYTIDKGNPTVISINRANTSPTVASSVAWTVTFSESVSGVDTGDFVLVPGVGLNATAITSVAGSGAIYTVSANTGTGSGTLGLNLVDNDTIIDATNNKLGGAGSGNGSQSGQVYDIDHSWPVVTSITRDAASPIAADIVTWTVVFSKSVLNVDLADFSLVSSSGLTGAALVSPISGSGTTWNVAANTGVGSGTLGLNLVDDDTIIDSLGQKLGNTGIGNGNYAGEVYTITDTPAVAVYHMDENLWNGTTDEVIDEAGNFHGRAINGAGVAATTAALSGDPGTCRYGVFDNTATGGSINRGYVELDTDFPDFEDDFTVAAWIRTTDNTKTGQYIFSDNATGAGYYLSLGDAGTGRLRFYSDGASAKNLDSANVISNNTWYFVAISADFSAPPTIVRKLYVFNASGALLAGFPISLSSTGWTSDPGDATLGGNASASSNGNHFRGNLDEVRVYGKLLNQSAITALATSRHACTSCTLASFSITQDATALACPDTRAMVSIKPMCQDGTTVKSDYSGTVNLGVTPSNANAAFYTADSGGTAISSVGFVAGDLSKTIYAYYPNEASACVTAGDGVVSTTSTTCTSFHAYGFKVSTQPSDFACGETSSLTLTAYGRLDTNPSCSVITGFSGNKNLKAWFSSGIDNDNPLTAQANNRVLSINGSASGITDKTEPASANLSNVNFSNGVATLTVGYPNAGKILGLNFKHDAAPYNGSTCPATAAPFCPLTATSNAFVVYPNSFALTVTDGGACTAGDATCAIFKAAGDSFNMKLQALCKDGSTLATDYMNGSSPIALSVNVVAPATGASGSVGTASTSITSNAYKDFTQTWSEVGVATFAASPPAWFGHAFASVATGNIGRFTPHHFVFSAATITPALGTFSYMDQPFAIGFTLTAANASGGTTSNYTTASSFARLNPTDAALWPSTTLGATGFALGAKDGSSDLSSRLALTGAPSCNLASCWTAGVAKISANLKLVRPTTTVPDTTWGPYNLLDIGIAPQDSDGVKLAATALNLDANSDTVKERQTMSAQTKVRYGRLRLTNTFGSVKPLKMPVEAQIWGGKSWIKNVDDTGITGTVLSSVFSLQAPNGWTISTVPANLTSGEALISIAPNAAGSRILGADLASFPWLKSKWNDLPDQNPSATATFGIFAPEYKKTIHIREVY